METKSTFSSYQYRIKWGGNKEISNIYWRSTKQFKNGFIIRQIAPSFKCDIIGIETWQWKTLARNLPIKKISRTLQRNIVIKVINKKQWVSRVDISILRKENHWIVRFVRLIAIVKVNYGKLTFWVENAKNKKRKVALSIDEVNGVNVRSYWRITGGKYLKN